MKILIALCFLCSSLYCFSQTYVGPFYGRSWSHVEGTFSEETFYNGVMTQAGYSAKSNLLGIRIDQHLSNKFIFSFTGQMTSKTVDFFDRGIVGYTHLRYKVKSSSVTLNYNPLPFWSVGMGGAFDWLHKIQVGKTDIDTWSDPFDNKYNLNQFSLVFATSFRFKGFVLEGRWLKGGNTFGDLEIDPFVGHMDSFELTLGYVLKIFGREKK
ncbi:MAG: hypothetical protein AAFZ15_11570 [Bacteroidota bacterium]